MADPTTVDNGALTDYDVATDEVVDGVLGTVKVQYVKLMDGTLDATGKVAADATNGLDVDVTRVGGNVTVVQGTPANLKVDASGVAVPVTDNAGSLTVDAPVGTPVFVRLSDGSTAIATLPVSLASVPAHAVTNAGTFVTQENGAGLTALQLIDDTVFADDAAFTVATSKVNAIGYLADETSTDSVDEGDVGAPRMTLDRKQIVTVEPHTAGGWDCKNCTSGDGSTALTNSVQAIKASAGKLGGWYIYNPNAVAAYVPIYNVASGSVTVGTTNPLMVIAIPATSAANLEMVNGITFDTAIAAAAATTAAGNTALGSALDANFFYK